MTNFNQIAENLVLAELKLFNLSRICCFYRVVEIVIVVVFKMCDVDLFVFGLICLTMNFDLFKVSRFLPVQLFDESYLAEVDEFMEEEGVLIAIDVAQANGHPLEVLIQLHLLFIA